MGYQEVTTAALWKGCTVGVRGNGPPRGLTVLVIKPEAVFRGETEVE
jgi:hypothetical protein